MDTLQDRMNAKAAVDAAFVHFRELFGSARTTHVLLEGLEYLDSEDQWRVVIGFDAGRHKDSGGPLLTMGLGPKTTEPIREFRTIYINARDGSFVRMDNG